MHASEPLVVAFVSDLFFSTRIESAARIAGFGVHLLERADALPGRPEPTAASGEAVKIDIAPRPRGAGFQFVDKIVGGAVPRNFIPAVGEAAETAARRGPFGYPVVDISVTLVDGGFHTVDSSDMAFKTATSMAMKDGLAAADPVLLEPIDHVTISVPNEYTARAQRLLTGRRGQILGFSERPGWSGWDDVEALVPEAELHDLIIELRSQTMGLGTYRKRFDHLAEARGAEVKPKAA